jgi:hypothetical protein
MSERLTAPARSPLRRIDGKESPLHPKHPQPEHSKSPIRRSDARTRLRSNGNMDAHQQVPTEADSFREQAEVADVEHDIAHLSPALQRFWQVRFV